MQEKIYKKTTRKEFYLYPTVSGEYATKDNKYCLESFVPAILVHAVTHRFCHCLRWGDDKTEYAIFNNIEKIGYIRIVATHYAK